MDTPLWYRALQRRVSFEDYLSKLRNPLYSDGSTLPILVLSALYGHDPYVDDLHILQRLLNSTLPEEKLYRALYLYSTVGRSFAGDTVLAGGSEEDSFSNMMFGSIRSFSEGYLYGWAGALLSYLFATGPLEKKSVSYSPGELDKLKVANDFLEEYRENRFALPIKTVDQVYRVATAHQQVKEIKEFLLGKSFPSLLRRHRDDKRWFRSVVESYWPQPLYAISLERPFDREELELIKTANEQLFELGELELVLFYFERMEELFGPEHELVLHLKELSRVDSKRDAERIRVVMYDLDPHDRKRYFFQRMMVVNSQVGRFIQEVERTSFVEAFLPYIKGNKKRIEKEISVTGSELANSSSLNTQTPFYMFNMEEMVFHIANGRVYFFLREELDQLTDRVNPYDRQPLPKKLFDDESGVEARAVDELWESVLRRRIVFPDL